MSDLCVECGETVRPLQHAFSCDICEQWQHRTCNTGVSRIDYFQARKRLIIIDFTCRRCKDVSDAAAEPGLEELSLAESISSALHSTLAESPPRDALPAMTFNLEFSTGSADVSVDDGVMNSTYIIRPAEDHFPEEEPEGAFDVTRVGADISSVMELSLGDSALTDTIVEDDGEVMKKRVTLKRDIRQEAVRDIHAPAGRVVDDKMVETFGRDDFNLPRPRTLVRQLNRPRETPTTRTHFT